MTPNEQALNPNDRAERSPDSKFLIALGRAFGGAIFFSLPLLMTMEMWWLGFYMDRNRLALFLVVMIPMLIVLDRYSGFEQTSNWRQDTLDGFTGYGVGFIAAAVTLFTFNVIDFSMGGQELIGKIALQAVPAGFGAVLANSQFGQEKQKEMGEEEGRRDAGYGAELFFMIVGATFLAFNVAPTEEMILLAFRMSPWHTLALVLGSLALMHAFVFVVDFRGSHGGSTEGSAWGIFLRFTVVGYVLAFAVSAYVLWSFGRFEEGLTAANLGKTIVLAFPASLGAAAARLIL